MKVGDLVKVRRILGKGRNPGIFGILLEEPKFPTWGNFPMRYTILTEDGPKTWVEERGCCVYVVNEGR